MLGNLRDGGFTGPVVPGQPGRAARCAGLPAYPSAADVPAAVDLARGRRAGRGGRRGRGGLRRAPACAASSWCPAGSPRPAPAERGAAAAAALVDAARAHGMRVVGPNCLGIVNTDPAVRLNATLAPVLPRPGRVGFFSQSGALGIALLAEADRRGLGPVHASSRPATGPTCPATTCCSTGSDDPHTDVVLLYLETFGNPRKFARLARRLARTKPVVAVASAGARRPAWPATCRARRERGAPRCSPAPA